MNKYEAEVKKQYSHVDGKLVTAKEKIAYAINDEWIYSMHWKNDTWITQASRDLQKRISFNVREYNLLKQAEELLNSIGEDMDNEL